MYVCSVEINVVGAANVNEGDILFTTAYSLFTRYVCVLPLASCETELYDDGEETNLLYTQRYTYTYFRKKNRRVVVLFC